MDKTLWLDIQQNRYFAIPIGADIPVGALTLHRLNGKTQAVSAEAVAQWEVTGDAIPPYIIAGMVSQLFQQVVETAHFKFSFSQLKNIGNLSSIEAGQLLHDVAAVLSHSFDEPDPARIQAIKAQLQLLGIDIGTGLEVWLDGLRAVYLQLDDRTYFDKALAQIGAAAESITQLQNTNSESDAMAIMQDLRTALEGLLPDTEAAAEQWVNQITNGNATADMLGIAASDEPFQVLGTFLREDGWNPQQIEDNIYGMGYEGRHGRFVCFAGVREELQVFVFYAVAPENAPPELLPAIYEFTVLANFGLYLGNFEVDPRDGEIRFRYGLDFQDDALSPALIRNAIYSAVATMDRYLPALTDILENGKSVEEAVAAVEND